MDRAAGLLRARNHARHADRDPTAETTEWVPPVPPGKRPRTLAIGPAAVDGQVQARIARALLEEVNVLVGALEEELAPAFRAAVDALELRRAVVLGEMVLRGVLRAEGSLLQARAQLSGGDLPEATRAEERVDRCFERIHHPVSCFSFRGQPVCAGAPHVRASWSMAAAVVMEVKTTVALLGKWHEVTLALGDAEVRSAADRRRAVDLMTAMRTRPVHFCFLAAVARAEGHEDLWRVGDTSTGSLLGKAEADNAEQLLATGASRDRLRDGDDAAGRS